MNRRQKAADVIAYEFVQVFACLSRNHRLGIIPSHGLLLNYKRLGLHSPFWAHHTNVGASSAFAAECCLFHFRLFHSLLLLHSGADRRLLEETFTSEAEAEALPSLPSGFYDAFVLRGIRVVQALQPGTLLCHFNVPSRLLVSQLSLSLSLSLSLCPRVEF